MPKTCFSKYRDLGFWIYKTASKNHFELLYELTQHFEKIGSKRLISFLLFVLFYLKNPKKVYLVARPSRLPPSPMVICIVPHLLGFPSYTRVCIVIQIEFCICVRSIIKNVVRILINKMTNIDLRNVHKHGHGQ